MATLPDPHEPRRVVDVTPSSCKQSATVRYPVLVALEVVETHQFSHDPE